MLNTGESAAEEQQWLELPLGVLMEYTSYRCVRGISGEGGIRCMRMVALEMAFFTSSAAVSISWLTGNSFLEADRESVKGRTMWGRRRRKSR